MFFKYAVLDYAKAAKTVQDLLMDIEKMYLQHIFEKLGVSSVIEAMTKAIQLGYIPPIC